MESTAQVANACPKLRDELRYTLGESGGDTIYTIEDPVADTYYRVGTIEYAFLSRMDGKNTVDQLTAYIARQHGEDSITSQQAMSIIRWAHESGLLETSSVPLCRSDTPERFDREPSSWERLNPLVFRTPLGEPDAWLERPASWFGKLFEPLAIAVVGMLLVAAMWALSSEWASLTSASSQLFAPRHWPWLLASWVGLKLWHEFGHAVACTHFGGRVREVGIVWILFAPLPYVDVTSAWRLPSRGERMTISAAGVYFELIVASLAALLAANSDSPLIRYHAYQVVMLASLTTLVFNANFLMRFDGYYLLSDWLSVPNLYQLGQQDTRYLAKRYLCGASVTSPVAGKGSLLLVRSYGIASAVWRLVVCLLLVIAASRFLDGIGLLLASSGVLFWLAAPVAKAIKYAFGRHPLEHPSRFRFTGFSLAGVLLLIAAGLAPWPGSQTTDAILRYADQQVIRTSADGLLEAVAVDPGDKVHEGDLLAKLANPALEQKLLSATLQRQQAELRLRVYLTDRQHAAAQAEQDRLTALVAEERALAERVRSLAIRSPCGGRVVSQSKRQSVGSFLREGEVLFEIANPKAYEVVALLPASTKTSDVMTLESAVFRCQQAGGKALPCQMETLAPLAATNTKLTALTTRGGGQKVINQQATEQHASSLVSPGLQAVYRVKNVPLSTPSGVRGQLTAEGLGESGYQRVVGLVRSLP